MSFGSPWVLAGLAALPLLTVVYALRLRGRGTAGEAFAAPHMLASVQPRRPGWRRHAPVLVLLLAVAALILAGARPQRSVAVPVERASIMLATDVSGSMLAKDVSPDRLTAAKSAALAFLDKVPAKLNVGIMAFNQAPDVLQSPTTDRDAAKAAVNAMEVSGGTATGEAVNAALRVLSATPSGDDGKRPPAAIILLSDGKSTRGADPVEAARAAGEQDIPIYTVALGTDAGTIQTDGRTEKVPPDPATLQQMAEASGGESFTVADASKLDEVYQRLGSQLSSATKTQQVTSLFAGGGLLLLLAAGGMSLRWFGRLV
ncbi:MAG: VWA domain-containing protein [Solirubrobacteraceae bacterium]